jgi:hypothetical protein
MQKIINRVAVAGLALVAVNSWAASASIEGVVKDSGGRPVSGANVKIWPRYNGTWTKFVKTDANGHYSYDGVAPGIVYVVTLIVNSKVEASISDVKPKFGSPTQLNFDLKKTPNTAQAAGAAKSSGSSSN